MMGRRVADLAALTVATLIASRGWAGGWIPALALSTAVMAGYGLIVACGRVGLSLVGSVMVLGLAAVTAGQMLTLHGGGLLDSLPRLLTSARPAPPTADLLLPGLLIVLLVGLGIGALSTLPAASGSVAGLVGAGLIYVFAELLTAGHADPWGLGAAAVLIVVLGGWLVSERGGVPGRNAPGLMVATPLLAVCGVVVVLLAGLPTSSAFDLRSLVRSSDFTLIEPSPLPHLAVWAQRGDEPMLVVRGQLRARLRLVVLSDFTGATWRAGRHYYPLGAAPTARLRAGKHRIRSSVEITIRAMDGPWLPTPGEAVRTSVAAARVDPGCGCLALSDRLRPGLRYTVDARSDAQPSDSMLAKAQVPVRSAVRNYLALPELPPRLSDYAKASVAGAHSDAERAHRIVRAVVAGRSVDATAPAGSSYARLQTFLFGDQDTTHGAQAGTSEQFATAFATLARAVGLPTRIVVGFGDGQRRTDGDRLIRGRDIMAWPEVYFTGLGWVDFDLSPQPGHVRHHDDGAERPGQPLAPAAAPTRPPITKSRRRAGEAPHRPVVVLAALGAAIPLAAVVVLIGLRGRRRRRHRRGGAAGAWSEVLDLCTLIGYRPSVACPAPAVAADLARLVPSDTRDHPATILAWEADRGAFAGPHATQDPVWQHIQRLQRLVRRSLPWYRRLLLPADPRPLRRR